MEEKEENQIRLNPMMPRRYSSNERAEIRKKEKEIMNGTPRKIELTEYKFLRLFLTTYIAEDNIPIIGREYIEKELAKYYNNSEYKFLFEDVVLRHKIDEENSLNLSDSFLNALAYGMITMIRDGSVRTKYIINITSEKVPGILEEYTEKQINAMSSIVNSLIDSEKESSDESKPKVNVKTTNN